MDLVIDQKDRAAKRKNNSYLSKRPSCSRREGVRSAHGDKNQRYKRVLCNLHYYWRRRQTGRRSVVKCKIETAHHCPETERQGNARLQAKVNAEGMEWEFGDWKLQGNITSVVNTEPKSSSAMH